MHRALRLKIWHKLFITLLLVIALILLLTAVLSQQSFTRGFDDYLEAVEQRRIGRLQTALIELYREEGSWQGLVNNPRRWYRLLVQADLAPPLRGGNGAGGRHPRRTDARPPVPAADEVALSPLPPGRVTLFAPDGRPLVGPRQVASSAVRYPLAADEPALGYLMVERHTALHHVLDQQFARQQREALYLIALLALVLAVLASGLLARQFARPLRELSRSTRRLISGDFSARVARSGSDELAQLGRHFNELAQTLEENRLARNRWIADISHELRTPLTVLGGELDALEDGVRPLNLDAVQSLAVEIAHLQRLVNDLYELSLSDAGGLSYHKEPLHPVVLLQAQVERLRPAFAEQNLALTLEADSAALDAAVLADPQRLEQLFANLLENSLRYTDPGGGLGIQCRCRDQLEIELADSAPGLAPDQYERIFERLYRADPSRSRQHGGSGLGLAIAHSIVLAHGGTIEAHASAQGGVSIRVCLPLLDGR